MKKILIIDEAGFSRICSAILESKGFVTDTVSHADEIPRKLDSREFGLVVTSYPYGAFLFDEIKKRSIPTIILSDNIDESLIETLRKFENTHCMIKPLDYDKFKTLVRQTMNGEPNTQGGYSIV